MKSLNPVIAFVFLIGCSSPAPETESEALEQRRWWKEGIIYQIYPRSFNDSDGDGVGDLQGIIEKLDYIQSLGVTMVWLNPIYSSPNADNGYDISDYRDIMHEFGTMEHFDRMLSEMHERGIKFVMDVVVNHSSDEHHWFQQSRSSRDNPYRDYYHWWPAEKGEPPYRWSFFDEESNAWEYDSRTDSYYLHYFAEKQPDLKWENPKVRQEVYDIMKFWARKGVDGFRLDAFQFVSKDTTFAELPAGFEHDIIQYYGMGPNLHEYLKEMYNEVLSQYDVFAVSEGAGSSFADAHSLVDADRNELQMAYHFEGMDVGNSLNGYDLSDFKAVYTEWDSAFAESGWLSVFLANHDVPRMVSKFGNDSPEFRAPSSKMLNTFILSMRGTPYCYFGDEIGMTNIGFATIDEYQDIAAINGYKKVVRDGGDIDHYMENLKLLSRDNARTPMQWNSKTHAGFTSGTPWIPVNDNYKNVNVANQEEDPESCLNYFRKMVRMRKENPTLVYGDYTLLFPEHEQIYAYIRDWQGRRLLVLLNFSEGMPTVSLSGVGDSGEILINNYPDVNLSGESLTMKPYQAIIYSLEREEF